MSVPAYPAAAIANAFLSRAFRDRRHVDPMKIQKLCYLAYGYALVDLDTPIINEEFEAWQFGPVLPSLYHECKAYRWNAITEYLKDYNHQTESFEPVPYPKEDEINEIIDFVWSNFGEEEATALSDWTHVKGGPWDKVTEGGTTLIRNKNIPDKLIKEYFEKNLYD